MLQWIISKTTKSNRKKTRNVGIPFSLLGQNQGSTKLLTQTQPSVALIVKRQRQLRNSGILVIHRHSTLLADRGRSSSTDKTREAWLRIPGVNDTTQQASRIWGTHSFHIKLGCTDFENVFIISTGIMSSGQVWVLVFLSLWFDLRQCAFMTRWCHQDHWTF